VKKRLFGLISIAVGVVLGLGVVELTAIAWLYVEDGRYTPAAELFDRTQNTFVRDLTKGTECRYVDRLFPHPYVGFVHHGNPPCGVANVNNVGLFNDDFPTVKREDRYTILLTGGSVASQLAQFDPRPKPRYLEDELNDRYVSPNGKPFLVLNGGDGGWKQPQPFILFSLYASSIDAVIVVGGLNEFYMFRPFERERLERPASNFPDVNPLVAESNFGDAAIGWVMGRIAGVLALNPVLGHSHAAYLIIRGIEAAAKSHGTFKSSKRTTLDSIFALPSDAAGDGEKVFALQLALYRKYLRATEAIARDYGVKTAYFFQAVPAYGKTLTAREKAVVGDLSYGPLYRRMVEAMMTQRNRGLPMFDLGGMLTNVKDTIYADEAHFIRSAEDGASPGYRLMAKCVARDLAKAWGLQRKAASGIDGRDDGCNDETSGTAGK
jgi:hypothetical protein